MKNTDLQALVQAVEQLIQRNTELRTQNKALREERGHFAAMISRLKALEQDS